MALTIGVLKENGGTEKRVSVVPETVRKAVALGLNVIVEKGAGDSSYFHDSHYADAGADVLGSRSEILGSADILATVQRPSVEDIEKMRPNEIVIGMIYPLMYPEVIEKLANAGVTAFSLELMPRITRAQPMDVLSSQASVIGYRAAVLGASISPRIMPMLTTSAGTVRPGKALVIGAGVAGLMAISTLKRLGASVSAFDVRKAAGEDVRSLGARFLEGKFDATGAGGYARDLTEDEKKEQQELLRSAIADSDLVITAAGVPGKPAQGVITNDMVDMMRDGSVIIDTAAESGGNCASTVPGKTVRRGGVTISGPENFASGAPCSSSEMFSRNILAFISLLVSDEGGIVSDFKDPILAACLVADKGKPVGLNK